MNKLLGWSIAVCALAGSGCGLASKLRFGERAPVAVDAGDAPAARDAAPVATTPRAEPIIPTTVPPPADADAPPAPVVPGTAGKVRGYESRVVLCESTDARWHECPTDTRGGMELVRQVSGNPCQRGESWGFDERGVWVTQGCRAEFRRIPPRAVARDLRTRSVIRCESGDARVRTCPVSVRGGVRLVRELSAAPCTRDRSWGYDRNGIWVSRGCRGEFELGQGEGGPAPLVCESKDRKEQRCDADTANGIQLLRQLSGTPCVEGETWGHDARGVWVTGGCRAEFTQH